MKFFFRFNTFNTYIQFQRMCHFNNINQNTSEKTPAFICVFAIKFCTFASNYKSFLYEATK